MKSLAIFAILAPLFWSIAGASPIKKIGQAARLVNFMKANEVIACRKTVYSLGETKQAADSAKAALYNAQKAGLRKSGGDPRSRLSAMNLLPPIWNHAVPSQSALMKYPLFKHGQMSYEKQTYIYNDFVVLDEDFNVVEILNGDDGSRCERKPINQEMHAASWSPNKLSRQQSSSSSEASSAFWSYDDGEGRKSRSERMYFDSSDSGSDSD
ncbi:hypothetical protein K3495_g5626 [Podosphaera aphanis]|nr:hypothetical protein K3495_g5626 [Podosphaera aphanis]